MVNYTKQPFVSVCIPVFNGERFILDCINSVLKQSYGNLELVVIDNCSNDTTPDIVKKVKDKRLRYIKNDENIGAINNFSKCVEEAKGNYFVLLPHDDILLPGCISSYVDKLLDPKIGVVYSSIRVIDENGSALSSKVNHAKDQFFGDKELIRDIIDNFVPIQLAMVRTSVVKKVGKFNIDYGLFCDVHLWLKIALDGWGAFYHYEPFSAHRSHRQQGQIAFNTYNLEVLSEHWGKKLDKTFWIENSYSHLFLKLSQFLLSRMEEHGYDVNYTKTELLKLFSDSHLYSLFRAMANSNWFVLRQELLLIKTATKLYGKN